MNRPLPIARRVPADGIQLNVAESGDPAGPVLVWLHGAGPGANGLQNFGGNLAAFAGYRNLVFDLPRYGLSDKPVIREPLFSYNARQVIAALRGMGVEQASFIGNSMGGATALRVACQAPALVDKLIVMGSAGAIPEDQPLTEPLLLMLDVFKNGPTREKIDAIGRSFVFDPNLVSAAMIEERFQAMNDPELLRTAKESLMKPESVVPELPAIAAPTLILWGREDRVLPLAWAQPLIERLPHAELRVVSQCGHWVQIEQRDWFNRQLADFLTH